MRDAASMFRLEYAMGRGGMRVRALKRVIVAWVVWLLSYLALRSDTSDRAVAISPHVYAANRW